MPTKNIFAGNGIRSQFVNLVYQMLMKREFVSYADVLMSYYNRPEDYFDNHSLSSEPGCGELKKAFPAVLKALKEKYPGCVKKNGKTKRVAFKYVGSIDDPLSEERNAIVQKSLEDYVEFCRASAGILPASWFSSFFENTQLLLDINRESANGTGHISSGFIQELTNIHLLPFFYKAITECKVLRFSYKPFDQEPFMLTFHPQYLKEYNGRWFVFGDADRKPFKAFNVALDRICGDITIADDVKYVAAEKGFYQNFFQNIVGVTHEKDAKDEKDAKVEHVVIRTKTEYQHGLIQTKRLHSSQRETLPFGEYEDGTYGEVALEVEPNRELLGRILAYGQFLEVKEPEGLRNQIKDILKKQIEQYDK